MLINNEDHTQEKGETGRLLSSSEFIKSMKPCLKRLGITRIGNITGLDRLDVPVTIAVRPNAKTISINSGKGLTLDEARASAIAEGAEMAIAENAKVPSFKSSWNALHPDIRIPMDDLALTKASAFHPSTDCDWTGCLNLIDGKAVAAPAVMIQLHSEEHFLKFQCGSNGLSSGGTLLEALSSGISEVIERDAWTIFDSKKPPRVILNTIGLPVIHQIQAHGAILFVYDITTDIGVPCYKAIIADSQERSKGIFAGFGCHPDKRVAVRRAILEAVQGRCCYTAGARDDMFRRNFIIFKNQNGDDVIKQLRLQCETLDFSTQPTHVFERVDQDVEFMINQLKASGIQRILMYDMTQSDIPLKVIRIIIPGLEGHLFPFYAPGHRAKKYA